MTTSPQDAAWNRSTAAAQKIEDILRTNVDGPSEGVGTLAIVLASIASKNNKGPLDQDSVNVILRSFATCFSGALVEIQSGHSGTTH